MTLFEQQGYGYSVDRQTKLAYNILNIKVLNASKKHCCDLKILHLNFDIPSKIRDNMIGNLSFGARGIE